MYDMMPKVRMPGKKANRKLPAHTKDMPPAGKNSKAGLLGALGGMLQHGMMKNRQRKGA